MRFFTLHTKGAMTLSLLAMADTVSQTNAVSFWSNINNFGKKNHQQNGYHDDEHSHGAAPWQQSRRSIPQQTLDPRTCSLDGACWKKRLDCCSEECSHCLPERRLESLCDIRGGAVEAAVDAVAPYGLSLNTWKVLFQVFLTAMNVFCWLVPLKSKKISQNKFALSMANAFSGGVFLSLAFGHLIPECVEGFHGIHETAPYLLVLAGYLLIFFVEKVAFDAHEMLHEMEHANHSDGDDKRVNGDSTPPASAMGSGRGAVILLGALAVHSVLEMMALGLANNFGDCALLTLSISLHQPAESIALLVAFLKSGLSEGQVLRYLSIFSCMGPIGVGLGMAVSEYASPIMDSIMLAIVAGTFVYVGATEVIPEEWEDGTHKWPKFGALMAGIGTILLITQYTTSLGGH